jgi:protein subunit release factor A
LTLHKLDQVLEGDLDSIIEALIAFDRAEQLKKAN